MNSAEKKLVKKIQTLTAKDTAVEIPAFMGDLSGTVKADNNGNSYVVTYNGDELTVKNHVAPNIPRIPVVIGYKVGSSVLEVLRLRDAYDNSPYVNIPAHAEKTHGEFGVDPVRVSNGQILAGLAFPIAGTMTVQFFGCVYYFEGYHILPSQVLDFSAEVPLTVGAHFVLVEVDSLGAISFRSGATVAGKELLTYEDIPLISATAAPLFAISVYFGQTELKRNRAYTDIWDIRFAGVSSGGLASSVDWNNIYNIPPFVDQIDAVFEGHTHGIARWVADGSSTVYELPDYARELNTVFDNALRVDPWELTLGDGQVIFTTAPAAGHLLTADYILKQI